MRWLWLAGYGAVVLLLGLAAVGAVVVLHWWRWERRARKRLRWLDEAYPMPGEGERRG